MGLTGRANQWTHTKPKLHWLCRGSSAVLSGRTQSCTHETCVQDAVAATMANAQSAAAATAKPGERPRLLALPVSPVTAVSTAPYDTILLGASCLRGGKPFHLAQKKAFMAGVGILFTQVAPPPPRIRIVPLSLQRQCPAQLCAYSRLTFC